MSKFSLKCMSTSVIVSRFVTSFHALVVVRLKQPSRGEPAVKFEVRHPQPPPRHVPVRPVRVFRQPHAQVPTRASAPRRRHGPRAPNPRRREVAVVLVTPQTPPLDAVRRPTQLPTPRLPLQLPVTSRRVVIAPKSFVCAQIHAPPTALRRTSLRVPRRAREVYPVKRL